MMNPILEITENEYLIKLNRSNFDLSFIRSLLKIVEVSEPAAQKSKHSLYSSDDMHFVGNQNIDRGIHSSEPDYYSSLDEK
jgi:hypothetical protein